MKKTLSILILLLLINSVAFAQENPTRFPYGIEGSTSNPNEVIVTTETQLYSSSSDKIYKVQGNITLTDDRTIPSNVTLIDDGGSIDLSTYTLTGSNTKTKFTNDKLFLDCKEGILDGTWVPESEFNQKNLGAIGDGIQLNDVNITSGTATVTSASATFVLADIGKTIAIVGAGANADSGEPQNYVLTSTIVGITDPNTVTIADNAINTATNAAARYGTDNYNAILQAAYLRNQQSGTLNFVGKDEVFLTSIELTEAVYTYDPIGWVIGNGTNNVHWVGQGAIIQLFPHDVSNTVMLRFQRTADSSIEGMHFKGDRDIYWSENGKGEQNHCIAAWTSAIRPTVKNTTIEYFYADAYIGGGDQQFVNYLQGDTAPAPLIQDSDWTVGNISDTGVIDGGDTDYVYSTTAVSISSFHFNKSTFNGSKPFYFLTGGSYSGWAGMLTPYYYAIYYSDAGTTFVHKSERQRMYDKITIDDPDNWKYIRIVVEAPIDKEDLDLRVRPALIPEGEVIENCLFQYNGRQGISNLGRNFLVNNCIFQYIGGINAGPGFGIDLEDNHGLTSNGTISNCTFLNNWGDIKLISCSNIKLFGNTYLTPSIDVNDNGAPTQVYHSGILSSYGRKINISKETIYQRTISLDRQDMIDNIRMEGGIVYYSANANTVKNSKFRDVTLYGDGIDPNIDRLGYPTIIENNEFRYNRSLPGQYLFRDPQLVGAFKNNTWHFNDVSDLSYEATDSSVNLVSGVDILFFYQSNMTADYGGGFLGGNKIYGILPSPTTRDHTGTIALPISNMEGVNEFYHSILFQKGLPQDRTIDGLKIKNGWLSFGLDQFENSIVSTTPVLTFNDAEITVTTDYPWTNTNARMLTTPSKNVSLVFNDLKIDLQQTSSVIGSSNRFIKFSQLGTLTFVRPDWSSASSKTLDFTSTFIVSSTAGAITIQDPVNLNNLTLTLRSIDHVVFTGPNKYMTTYAEFADETAADAAGYPNGYWYITPSGDLKYNDF